MLPITFQLDTYALHYNSSLKNRLSMRSRQLGILLLVLCSSLVATFVCIRLQSVKILGSVLSDLAFSFSSGGLVSLKDFQGDEIIFATDGAEQEAVDTNSMKDLIPDSEKKLFDPTRRPINQEKFGVLSLDHLPPDRKPSGLEQIDFLARKYAPFVHLDKDEIFFPADVDFFFPNVHRKTINNVDYFTSKESLGCATCSAPDFLRGQSVVEANSPPPTYAFHVPGKETGSFQIIYFFFYPFNFGKKICIGLWFGQQIGCFGMSGTFGNHVGDWEHFVIDFKENEPHEVKLYGHGRPKKYKWGHKDLNFRANRPIIYAARGSHAMYPKPGHFTTMHVPTIFGKDLVDETSRGPLWDTMKNLVISPYRDYGEYDGHFWWMNFQGHWGNHELMWDGRTLKKKANECLVFDLPGESREVVCHLEEGPRGPMYKKEMCLPSNSCHRARWLRGS